MDVFHYVSHQLSGISLFDHNLQELLNSVKNEVMQLSQCSNLNSGVKPLWCKKIVSQKCIDVAVLEADIHTNHLYFETELQDCVGQPCSTEYMEEVYIIVYMYFVYKERGSVIHHDK